MRKIRLIIGLIALLALSACGDTYEVAEPEPVFINGMQNSWLVGDLLMGGQPSRPLLAQLAEQGYRTIVSVRALNEMTWNEKAEVEGLGMTFVNIPMAYPLRMITDDHVRALANVMEFNEKPLMIHGDSGDRVAALWGLWLAEHMEIESEEAIRLAGAAGLVHNRDLVVRRLAEADLLDRHQEGSYRTAR